MRPKDIFDENAPERRAIDLNNKLVKARRYQSARDAVSVAEIMNALQKEIIELAQELMTAHLVRRSNNESDVAIAENYVDIFRRVDYKIIIETLSNNDGFWTRLSSQLISEAMDPTAVDNTYPEDESVQLEYDLNYVKREIPNILAIVRKKLQDETR